MSHVAWALALIAVAAHVALFGWGFAQARPGLRRRAAPVFIAIVLLVAGVGAFNAWYERTHINLGEPE